MRTYLSKPPTKVVVDTGPLFTVLTLVYVRQHPELRQFLLHEHKLSPGIFDPTTEREFLAFFDSLKEVLTTSHVIGQIKSRRALRPDVYREFMLSSMHYLSRKGLDEQLLTLLSLYKDERAQKIACVFGPTDAGLLTLARREKCVLLTDDSRLLWEDQAFPDILSVKNVLNMFS